MTEPPAPGGVPIYVDGLKKLQPYWYNYTTMAKGRWLGREILEVVSTEFRDRSMEYYRYALESGVTTINGKVAKPDTIIKNGDRIENVVHRHEPPITAAPVKIIVHDKERQFIVIDKPGSIPVHAAGRFYKQSLMVILKHEHGFNMVYPVNRLDRLTSGLMIIPLSPILAGKLSKEFAGGQVKKEYIARCKGKFPDGETVCEEPLLTVDRQMGLNIVHPEGKHAKTVFTLLHYDTNTDSSVLHCRPLTGRSHQIRVHLQFLGHPIANDPIYSEERIWGHNIGKGGIDITPSEERAAPEAPPQFEFTTLDENPESLSKGTPNLSTPATQNSTTDTAAPGDTPSRKPMPRETGHDIGMGSPVPLSAEAVRVITRLRNMKDEDEDWGRWRDVIFRSKTALVPKRVLTPLPPQNRRRRGGPVEENLVVSDPPEVAVDVASVEEPLPPAEAGPDALELEEATEPDVVQLAAEDAEAKVAEYEDLMDKDATPAERAQEGKDMSYCPECYLPLHPDPKPEKLYIFLHALRYTTSLGCFETAMPVWAQEGWEWDRS
ncbi:pseudouridine synthase [Irpex rosettiformis]|uniref:Pseudouridine synthase n=1 Tax=Irpex rosettiformis TaxID=378272 RepID=A0ACB8U8Z6_9APHY|nr:pseudouridine synthase [Irpex rosettiformis]